MRWRSRSARTVVIGSAAVVFVICCVLPLASLAASALATGIGALASEVFLDERRRELLRTTVLLGAGTGVLATCLGVPLGFVLARVPLRGKALLRLGLSAPVLLPSYVTALAWTYLGGAHAWTYTLPTAVVVLSLGLYPVAMLAAEAAARRIDGHLEEAALIVAPPRRVLGRITLRLCAPTVTAAALVIFVLAISEFGVAAVLRVRVYTTEVFTAFASLYDFRRALVLALPLLVLSTIVALAAAALLSDRIVVSRRQALFSPLLFPQWSFVAAAAMLVMLAAAVFLPLAVLARQAAGGRDVLRVLRGSTPAILNSLWWAAGGATAIVAIAMWLGYARARMAGARGHLIDVACVVLFAVPSTLVGIGLIGLWNRPGPLGAVYGTAAMLGLAYAARFMPIAVLILSASAQAVAVSQEEAAAVGGAGWLRTMRGIVVPQMRPGLGAAWLITFVLAFGELGASILVAPPGESTLPIRVYTFMANTPPSQVAAMSLFQAVVVLVPLTAVAARYRHLG